MDSEILRQREQELSHFTAKAGQMYTGMQHLRLNEGVALLRQELGRESVDLYIVSAAYGLISEDRTIAPYDMTFNGMRKEQVIERSRFLGIKHDLEETINGYELVFFLLGEQYLVALELPLKCSSSTRKLIFLASPSNRRLIPNNPNYYVVEVGKVEAMEYGYGLVGLKGYLLGLFAKEVQKAGRNLIEQVHLNPHLFLESIKDYRKKLLGDFERPKAKKSKLEINYFVSQTDYARNYSPYLNYFIPECDDRVDPNYDFVQDENRSGRDVYQDYYAHDFFPDSNYDGLLVSKVNIEASKRKKVKVAKQGIHEFLRFPQNRGPIMGDCGAWSYYPMEVPPYTTDEILDYYESLGFDIGVSIDHLIGPTTRDELERRRRYKITVDNAERFIKGHTDGNYKFTPSGVAQGWDPVSYRDAVRDLIDMGYKHISLGGLAKANDRDILEIMRSVSQVLSEEIKLHLFGVGRLELLGAVHKLGVTSFDCARPLRQAWGGVTSNYYGPEGGTYSAIRVPQVHFACGKINKRIVDKNDPLTLENALKLERGSLEALRGYDQGLIGIEETLERVLEYDQLVGEGRGKHAELYRRVLEDMPWKYCNCPICKSSGIEVIIFRGNNRNRRRGFHNTYVYYKQLQHKMSFPPLNYQPALW